MAARVDTAELAKGSELVALVLKVVLILAKVVLVAMVRRW